MTSLFTPDPDCTSGGHHYRSYRCNPQTVFSSTGLALQLDGLTVVGHQHLIKVNYSEELTHSRFASLLESDGEIGFIPGCRCTKCYSKEITDGGLTGGRQQLAARVVSPRHRGGDGASMEKVLGRRLFPEAGEVSDFAEYFYAKHCYHHSNGEEEEERYWRTSRCYLVYPRRGVECLYRDLECVFLKFGWMDDEALGRVFLSLSEQLMGQTSYREEFFHTFMDVLLPTRYSGEPRAFGGLLSVNASVTRGLMDLGSVFSSRYGDPGPFADPRLDMVRVAAVSGNIGLLGEMLKFGATMFRPKDTVHELDRAVAVMSILWIGEPVFRSLNRQYFRDRILHTFDAPARRRLYVVVLGLEVMTKMRLQPDHASHYEACLRRVFDAIPEPKVRSCEIRDCLTRVLQDAFGHAVLGRAMGYLANEYESHFPESAGKVTPRSLKHLCRIEIRHSLKRRGCFIRGALHLDLPKPVKRYVTLDLFRSKGPTMFVTATKTRESFLEVSFFPMIRPDKNTDAERDVVLEFI